MASTSNIYPAKYLQVNTSQSKPLNVVLEIDGLPFKLSLVPTYKKVRYGDPGLVYGQPGLIYGGLVLDTTIQPWISMDSALNLQQTVEPEQGRGSISTLSFVLIDYQGIVSNFVSPGGTYLDEIMGRNVRVSLGYTNTSFPEDYYVAFRGYIVSVQVMCGKVTIQTADPNQKNRQDTFLPNITYLTADVDNAVTDMPVVETSALYSTILGPDSSNDPAVGLFIKIDDEYMSYDNSSLSPTDISPVVRGARGTTPDVHTNQTEVDNYIELTDNPITLALKIMLSGWNGPFTTGQPASALGSTVDTTVGIHLNAILLGTNLSASRDFGLTVGDYVTISGATNSGNNGQYKITGFVDAFQRPSSAILIDTNLTPESPSPAQLAFRSKYDTLPLNAGLQLSPNDVDVEGYEFYRGAYFSGNEYKVRIFVQDQQTGKSFIESELLFPFGAYSLTRYGRMSIGYTKPPIAAQKLIELDHDNILNPAQIMVTRAVNNRRFFNLIEFQYDVADDGSTFGSVLYDEDDTSLNQIGMQMILPIDSMGIRTALGGAVVVQRVANQFLSRYKACAYEITLQVNWEAGSLIETGDVILLTDNGTLQITNFATGERDIGQQLFEVIQRSIDIKSGNSKLTLLSGLDTNITDRYGTISPSSIVDSGGTTTSIPLLDSFGSTFEPDKWSQYVGLPIVVHSKDYTVVGSATFQGFDATQDHLMLLSAPLSFTPTAGMIVEIDYYPTSTDPKVNNLYKIIHAFIDPSIAVVSGISATEFTVSGGDVGTLAVGQTILVHNSGYSSLSPEVHIQGISGTTITVDKTLGFTPDNTMLVELIGFADGLGAYRIF